MPDDDDHATFSVAPDGSRFKVVDTDGQTQVVCADAASAGQYAALMNHAFARGFKAGYRRARQVNR